MQADQPLYPQRASPEEPPRWQPLQAGGPSFTHLYDASFGPGFFPRPLPLDGDNWFHDGHLRQWALLNLTNLVGTRQIHRGDGPVYMFGGAWIPSLADDVTFGFEHEKFPCSGKAITLREALAWTNTRGFLVLRNGRVVFEAYPGMDPSQRHHWMSVSKSAINILLGHFVGRGQIDLGKPVEAYLPELRNCGYGGFPLRELADMRARVSMNEQDYGDPEAPFWDWGRAIGWFTDRGDQPDGIKGLLRTIRRLEEPGDSTDDSLFYSGSHSQVLGWVIERISGLPLRECFHQLIWRHIGAVADAAVSVDRHGVAFAGGGWVSTLRDLGRYGMIWAGKGRAPDGTMVFDPQWLDHCRDGSGPTIFGDWCYQNHLYHRNGGISHQGHSGQTLWVNPESGTVVAQFGCCLAPNGLEPWTARLQLSSAEAIDRFLVDEAIAGEPAPDSPL